MKNALPERRTGPVDTEPPALPVPDGPWTADFWVVVEAPGDSRRRATRSCAVERPRPCGRPTYQSGTKEGAWPDGVTLCHAHSFQWQRAGRPDVAEFIAHMAKQPQERAYPGRKVRGVDFTSLPPAVADELRFVVGYKVGRGDWSPNRHLLDFLELLVDVVRSSGVGSLLDRGLDDWLLVLRTRWGETREPRSFDSQAAAYLRTGYVLLARALDPDPWRQDVWLWKGCFEFLIRSDHAVEHNVVWRRVEVGWLREAAKLLAKRALRSGSRTWGTVVGWTRALSHLSTYLTEEGIADAEDLDRETFLDFLAWTRELHGSKTRLGLVNQVAALLADIARDGLAALPESSYLRRGENPVLRTRDPKPFPQDVVERVDRLVLADPDVDASVRRMVLLLRWGGPRVSELVNLPLDCLRHNGAGGYSVEYWMPKVTRWRRFPVPDDLARDVLRQQEDVRAVYGVDAGLLFPSPSRSNPLTGGIQPWSSRGFATHLASLFERHGITQSTITGERVSGSQTHRFRHTIGTELLNNGWDMFEVQKFLGHASPTMTQSYAEIRDETLNAKFAAYHRGVVDRNGEPAGPDEFDADVERMRERFQKAALPNGYCALPETRTCDFRPNPCLECAFFRTTPAFLPVLRGHRQELVVLVGRAEANGNERMAEINRPMLDRLDVIIPRLEANEQEVRGA